MLELWFNDNDCLSNCEWMAIVLYSAFGVCYPQWCGHIRITEYSAWLWKGSQGRNCIEELMPTPPSILITMKFSHAQDGVRGLIYLGQWTAILGGSVSQPSGPPWIPSLRGLNTTYQSLMTLSLYITSLLTSSTMPWGRTWPLQRNTNVRRAFLHIHHDSKAQL
jgi:hypothetical protein